MKSRLDFTSVAIATNLAYYFALRLAAAAVATARAGEPHLGVAEGN